MKTLPPQTRPSDFIHDKNPALPKQILANSGGQSPQSSRNYKTHKPGIKT